MPEWLIGAVSKTLYRLCGTVGFESHPSAIVRVVVRFFSACQAWRRLARVVGQKVSP